MFCVAVGREGSCGSVSDERGERVRIGIDASRIAVAARTGTEHYSYEVLAALAQRDRQTSYTLYCNTMPAALPPLGTNITLRHIPFARLWTHVRLSAELMLHPPDLLFVPAHVLPLGVPLRRGMRSVVTIHDLGYVRFPSAHTPAHRLYLRLSTLWTARAATRLIAISAATRDDLVRFAHVPSHKIAVVPHGLSPRFRPIESPSIRAAIRSRYRIPSPYIFYVGTVQPRKNLVRLIDAFAQVHANRAGADAALTLVIAGKRGWRTEAIEQRAAALGIAAQVQFIGYVEDDDLPVLLSDALAFALPSLYEGFGMPVLEAMACGTPVLTSSTSALPEVAGDAALLVDPEDQAAIAVGLERLVTQDSLRAELRARGLARAAAFTWDRCAAQTLAVFHAALEA